MGMTATRITAMQPPRGADAYDRDGVRWWRCGAVWLDADYRRVLDWPELVAQRGPLTCRCECPSFTFGEGHRVDGRHTVSVER